MSKARESGNFPNVITASGSALVLDLTSSDITYDGQSLARVGTANVFTQQQTIQTASPFLLLEETDTVDLNFKVRVSAGSFFITSSTDAGANTLDVVAIDVGAKQLKLLSSDITYDGQSIARVGTPNVFTQTQSIDNVDIGEWSSDANYSGLFSSEGTPAADSYMIISQGLDTFISTPSAAGYIGLRPGNNDATKELKITTSDITYAGQSIARVGISNQFTARQDITAVEPGFRLFETDTTDKNYYIRVLGGAFFITQIQDSGIGVSTPLIINASARQLNTTSTDIKYDGKSVRSRAVRVQATGTLTQGPTGWTVSKTGTGVYRVTHNENAVFAVTVSHEGSAAVMAVAFAPSANYFDVRTFNSSGTALDASWQAICQLTS